MTLTIRQTSFAVATNSPESVLRLSISLETIRWSRSRKLRFLAPKRKLVPTDAKPDQKAGTGRVKIGELEMTMMTMMKIEEF